MQSTQQRIELTINGGRTLPKFVRSLALDFPDTCLQFFIGSFSKQNFFFLHTTLYIFTRLPTRQDDLQNRDYRMIRFSALLPISPPFRISSPFECVFF